MFGEYTKAELLIRERLAGSKAAAETAPAEYALHLVALGNNLLMQRKWEDAEKILRECLAVRENVRSPGWTTFNTQSMLGWALLSQKKYADAEPLLVKRYEGMKAREKTIPPQANTRIPEALDRLIELSTATNKPDEVKKYGELRAQYREVLPAPRKEK